MQLKFSVLYLVHKVQKYQCCQLAEILAAKHKSSPIRISAAGRNSGRIFKNWQKSSRIFLVCVLYINDLIIWRNRLANPRVHSRVDTFERDFFNFAKYEINTKVKINFAIFREISYELFREISKEKVAKFRKTKPWSQKNVKKCYFFHLEAL
jgi:hypothetical protein